VLTPLQRRLASLVRELPEAGGFALAGGAALIVRGLVDRTTLDLDYFATDAAAVAVLLPALEARLAAEGLASTLRRQAPGFVRLEVSDGIETVQLDLAHDAREHPADVTELGVTLAADELAADKMLALYGRAELRDFVDVAALLDVYSQDELLEFASRKDAGFTDDRFVEALAAIHRFDDPDFAAAGVCARELIAIFDRWREQLRG
jgi:hypothetical protein